MKTMKLFLILTIVGIIGVSCSDSASGIDEVLNVANEEKSAEVQALCGQCDFTGTLTEAEISGLMEMREEEKLAKQVYVFFYEKYNYPIFNNISKSENAHTSAVLHLIDGFGLTDPTPNEDTEFANPVFAELYKQLTEKGTASAEEALKTGAFIEELDIADLQSHLDETTNATVKRVYGNLLRASKNHLRAFSNVLKLRGETYTPTIITVEEYNEITGN